VPRFVALIVIAIIAFACPAKAETTLYEFWPGVWISLPEAAVVENQPRPIPRVRKQVRVDGVIVDLVRQSRGLPYGAELERRWLAEQGHRQIIVRERGNSYWASWIDRGYWYFNRKIRMSSKQMVEAYFSVPVDERHSEESRRKRAIIMSISLRRR